MTEKTDIRDSDEKVVEIEMGRLDKKNAVHNLLSAVIVFAVFVKNIEKLVLF